MKGSIVALFKYTKTHRQQKMDCKDEPDNFGYQKIKDYSKRTQYPDSNDHPSDDEPNHESDTDFRVYHGTDETSDTEDSVELHVPESIGLLHKDVKKSEKIPNYRENEVGVHTYKDTVPSIRKTS